MKKDWDKDLFKTLETKPDKNGMTTMATDKQFLKNLDKWLFNLSGNVNVSMRLKGIIRDF